jgi:hypothetical protein
MNYNPRLIKGQHSYSVEEIASLFGINKKTCFRWLQEGLEPIEQNTKPLLIWGNDLRTFLIRKKKEKKVTLGSKEFYCMKCKCAVRATVGTEKELPTGKKIGRNARVQLYRIGKCGKCGIQVVRYL